MLVFGLELVIKITGMGLKLYLSDVWNRIDMVIFLVGMVSELGPNQTKDITLFRTMRVLKPLRTI